MAGNDFFFFPARSSAHCTPNKSVTTLRYTRRHGPVYNTGHACRHLPSAVPWISEDRLISARAARTNSVSVIIVTCLFHTVLTLTLTTLYKCDAVRIGSVVDTAKRLYDNVYNEKKDARLNLNTHGKTVAIITLIIQ